MMSGILPPPGGGGQTPPTTQPQTTTSQSQPTGNGTQSATIKTEADVELTPVPVSKLFLFFHLIQNSTKTKFRIILYDPQTSSNQGQTLQMPLR